MGSQESRYPPELPVTVTVSIGACWRPGASWDGGRKAEYGRRRVGGLGHVAPGTAGVSLERPWLTVLSVSAGGCATRPFVWPSQAGEALPVRLSQSLDSLDSLDVVPRVQLLLWKHLSTLPPAGRGPSSLCREPIAVGHAPVAEFDIGGVGGSRAGTAPSGGPPGSMDKRNTTPPSHRPSSPYSPSTRSQ